MPFDLNQAALRLRALHGDPLAFRRALLDLAFASGCAVSEQAVALENGDAVALRIASGEQPAQAFAVVDLDPPGRGVWSPERDSLGGPLLAQTWAVALHALLQQRAGQSWALTYTRGPALGVPTWVQERVADDGRPIIQLAPCPSQPSSGDAQDSVTVTLRRAENIWRLPACDWTAALTVAGDDALPRLRAWLLDLPGDWTLHQLHQRSGEALTAVLRADRVLQAPPGIAIRETSEVGRLPYPVNDALLAWPAAWLTTPFAAKTLPDGLWLAGLTAPLPDDAPLPERAGLLTLEWQVEPLARTTVGQLRVAVAAAEAHGPVAAGYSGPIWRLPGAGEADLAVRALLPRITAALTA